MGVKWNRSVTSTACTTNTFCVQTRQGTMKGHEHSCLDFIHWQHDIVALEIWAVSLNTATLIAYSSHNGLWVASAADPVW